MGFRMDNMGETNSGHFSLTVSPTQDLRISSKVDKVEHASSTDLNLKEVEKLHHYWGHCSVEKLEVLIRVKMSRSVLHL